MEKVLVSACLLGEKVRYDGGDSGTHALLERWQREGRIVTHCPEQAGGLTVPREPAEIAGGDASGVLRGQGMVQNRDGRDVTDAFVDGAERALAKCWTHKIKIAVLKEGSPSCGSSRVHDGSFSGVSIRSAGITTCLLTGHGISVFSEDELDAAARRLAELERAHGE